MKEQSEKRWFLYELPPIDFGWEYLPTVDDQIRLMAAKIENVIGGIGNLTELIADWEFIKIAARKAEEVFWEGDFREAPRVFWLPLSFDTFIHGYVWKQDNNGTTYVASQVPLGHLESDESVSKAQIMRVIA